MERDQFERIEEAEKLTQEEESDRKQKSFVNEADVGIAEKAAVAEIEDPEFSHLDLRSREISQEAWKTGADPEEVSGGSSLGECSKNTELSWVGTALEDFQGCQLGEK